MARVRTAKKKSTPTTAELNRLKSELKRVTEQLELREREFAEAIEQEKATRDILRVIAGSPTELQPVLDALVGSAARLCDATDALIDRVDGKMLEHVAAYGPMPMAESRRPLSRGTPVGRAVIDRETVHIHDVLPLLDTEYPEAKARQRVTGTRAVLVVPLLRDGEAIGAIQVRRPDVRPFSEKQIALLKTFANQAIIAIENARLFQELKKALEQQTVTSDVLRVIAGAPTELQPVLDAVTESAVKLAGASQGHIRQYDGEFLRLVASYGESPEEIAVFQRPVRPSIESSVQSL